jgi:hypothetical protein
MRMRATHGAAAIFAATLAATVGNPAPAEAFFFLPIFQQQQSQPSIESRSSRSPSDNNRWRERGRDEAAQPVKPSTTTRVKRDEEKSSSNPSGKSGKSQAKSEASSSQASRTRSVRQETPPSKSSGRASVVHRESPAGGGSPPPTTQPAQASDPSAQAPSPARAGGAIGDTFDEKLGEVFKARIDEVLKQSN